MKYFDLKLRNYNASEIKCVGDNDEGGGVPLSWGHSIELSGQPQKHIDVGAAATHPPHQFSLPQYPVSTLPGKAAPPTPPTETLPACQLLQTANSQLILPDGETIDLVCWSPSAVGGRLLPRAKDEDLGGDGRRQVRGQHAAEGQPDPGGGLEKRSRAAANARADKIVDRECADDVQRIMNEFAKHCAKGPVQGMNLNNVQHTPVARPSHQVGGRGGAPGLGLGGVTPAGTGRGRGTPPGRGRGGGGSPGGEVPTVGWTLLNLQLKPEDFTASAEGPHTIENCRSPFLSTLHRLFDSITRRQEDSDARFEFQWLNPAPVVPVVPNPNSPGTPGRAASVAEAEENKLFLSMILSHIVFKGHPGCVENQSLADLFAYDPTFSGTIIDYSAELVLTGVSKGNPAEFYSVLDDTSNMLMPETSLRASIVLCWHMLRDLTRRRIRPAVTYEYVVVAAAAGPPRVAAQTEECKLRGESAVGIIMDALEKVVDVLDNVYRAQSAAEDLARGVQDISGEDVDQLEADVQGLILRQETVTTEVHGDLISRTMSLSDAANRVSRLFNSYEQIAREVSDGSITESAAARAFSNPKTLIQFLRNSSNPSTPWLRNTKEFSRTKAKVQVDGTPLKIMNSPSRFLVDRHLTTIDADIARIKELVAKVLDRAPRQEAAAGNPRPREDAAGVDTVVPPVFPACPPCPLPTLPGPAYPAALLRAAKSLLDRLMGDDTLGSDTPGHILSANVDQIGEILKEIHKQEWNYNVALTEDDVQIREDLLSVKTMLTGFQADQKETSRLAEIQQREVARGVTLTKGPALLESGENAQEFLEFHSTYNKAQNPITRALRLRADLPPKLKIRLQHVNDPDQITSHIQNLFLQSDVLIGQALKRITDLKIHPRIHTDDEQMAFTAIQSLIQKLDKQDMSSRLDNTIMSQCIARISLRKGDQFEEAWLIEQLATKGKLTASEEEALKRRAFIKFVTLQEIFLQKRNIQTSLAQSHEKKNGKKGEKSFKAQELQLRQTPYDKRQKKRMGEKKNGNDSREVVKPGCKCVLCGQDGGHPVQFGPKTGRSPSSIARCPKLKDTHQGKRIELVNSVNACVRCLSSSHSIKDCRIPEDTAWLRHPECEKLHNPVICDKRKTDRQHATRIETPGSESACTVINLAEQVQLRDHSGRVHEALAIFDDCSDSNWISTDLAQSLPPNKRKRCTVNLQTIRGTRPFKTWQYQVQINVLGTQRHLQVLESPSIGSIHHSPALESYLAVAMGFPVHLPQGQVQLLIGLKNHGLHPNTSQQPSPTPDLKVYTSSTSMDRKLVCGSIPDILIQGAGGGEHTSSQRTMFTQSELTKLILRDKSVDNVPEICDICRQRSKGCPTCNLLSRPTSLKDMREIELVKKNIFFDKKNQMVTCEYPATFSSFRELFPPHLSNHFQAKRISASLLKSLRKDGDLADFDKVFRKYIEEGIIRELSIQEMEKWEEDGNCVNYISFNAVKKEGLSEGKQKVRIITNSSLNRPTLVGGKEVQASLNSVLPQASPVFNPIEEIAMRWLAFPVSVLLDIQKAYSQLRARPGHDQMLHLRRLAWYKDPLVENPEPATYALTRAHYGDSVSSALLAATIAKVTDDMKEAGGTGPASAQKILLTNFVDDQIASENSVKDAFQLYEDFKEALSAYQIALHEPVVSSKLGKHDSVQGMPRREPKEGEEEEMRTIGVIYNPFSDTYIVPAQKRMNIKKRGLRVAPPMTAASVRELKSLSMRQVASFAASQWDVLGHLLPVKIFSKVLLNQIMAENPPTSKSAWDKPLKPELFNQALHFFEMICSLDPPRFNRFPPDGVLLEAAIFHDGAKFAFASSSFGIWVQEDGTREGKLLFARAKTSQRSIPDQELASCNQGTCIAKTLHRVFPSIKKILLLGDSESTHKMISSLAVAKDTFAANRVRSILNNTKELVRDGVQVTFYQVPSNKNEADRVSKPIEGAKEYVHSRAWKEGPAWLCEDESSWPCLRKFELVDDMISEVTDLKTMLSREETVEQEADDDQEEAALVADDSAAEEEGESNEEAANNGEGHICSEGGEVAPEHGLSGIFSAMLQRVSHIRIAVRVVARIKQIAVLKSLAAVNHALSKEREAEGWYTLLRDQQPEMDQKTLTDQKYMSFCDNGVRVSRQRYDLYTHKTMFNVDHLPLVDAGSRLGELLLRDGHRSPGGACRSRAHSKFHIRTSATAALLVGSEEKKATEIAKNCVPCRMRKIGIQGGKNTCFSPRMAIDRFKVADPVPFSSIAVDFAGPVRVALATVGCSTRRSNKYANHFILVVACTAGSGACRFIQVPSTSADGFAIGLRRLVAYCGNVPSRVYSDFGSGLVAAGKRESGKQTNDEDGDCGFASEVKSKYPNIVFETAKSGEQFKDGISEALVKQAKYYIRSVFGLKPNSSFPSSFTVIGLELLLEECSRVLNSRPTHWLKSQEKVLCPNSLLLLGFNQASWGQSGNLGDRYEQLQERRKVMYSVLREMMVNCAFLPTKWKKDEEKRMPKEGDIVLMSRQKNKISEILEYALVTKVLDGGRTLEMRVCRQGGTCVKPVTGSSRLAHLVFRP